MKFKKKVQKEVQELTNVIHADMKDIPREDIEIVSMCIAVGTMLAMRLDKKAKNALKKELLFFINNSTKD